MKIIRPKKPFKIKVKRSSAVTNIISARLSDDEELRAQIANQAIKYEYVIITALNYAAQCLPGRMFSQKEIKRLKEELVLATDMTAKNTDKHFEIPLYKRIIAVIRMYESAVDMGCKQTAIAAADTAAAAIKGGCRAECEAAFQTLCDYLDRMTEILKAAMSLEILGLKKRELIRCKEQRRPTTTDGERLKRLSDEAMDTLNNYCEKALPEQSEWYTRTTKGIRRRGRKPQPPTLIPPKEFEDAELVEAEATKYELITADEARRLCSHITEIYDFVFSGSVDKSAQIDPNLPFELKYSFTVKYLPRKLYELSRLNAVMIYEQQYARKIIRIRARAKARGQSEDPFHNLPPYTDYSFKRKD